MAWRSHRFLPALVRLLPRIAMAAAALLIVGLVHHNNRYRSRVEELRRDVARLEADARMPFVGQYVPAFEASAVSGEAATVGGASDGQAQILFVFNTTCPFCVQTLPYWEGVWSRVGESSIPRSPRVFGLSLDGEADTRTFLRERGISFPVVRFPGADLITAYRAEAVPLSLVVDPGGRVKYVRPGALTQPAVDSLLDVAMGEDGRLGSE